MSTEKSKSMRIVKLQSENFKRLVAVEIDPKSDGLVLITGENGAGKTSLMDAIMTTLAGGKTAPDKPIRDGATSAKTVILTENFRIERTFNAKGTKLKITNAEGVPTTTPQKLLDKIIGELAFDPLFWIGLGKTEAGRRQQRTDLMKLAGLDFSDLDGKIATAQADKADARKEKERLEHEAGRIEVMEFCPAKEVSVLDLTDKLLEVNEYNKGRDELIQSVVVNKAEQSEIATEIINDKRNIERLQKEIEMAGQCLVDNTAELTRLTGVFAAIHKKIEDTSVIDVDVIQKAITDLEITNGEVRKAIQKDELSKQAEAKAAEWRAFSQTMKDLEQKKATRLSEATFPLKGLSVTDDGVVYYDENVKADIPLNQVNGAGKLRIGLGVAMGMNPTLKVILMDANGLDKKSLAIVDEMTKEKGFQVWAESIHGEGGIVIEDGAVKVVAEGVEDQGLFYSKTVSEEAVEEASDFEKAVKDGVGVRAEKHEEDELF